MLKKSEVIILNHNLRHVAVISQRVKNELDSLSTKVENTLELDAVQNDVLELADVLRYAADQLVKSVIPAHKIEDDFNLMQVFKG